MLKSQRVQRLDLLGIRRFVFHPWRRQKKDRGRRRTQVGTSWRCQEINIRFSPTANHRHATARVHLSLQYYPNTSAHKCVAERRCVLIHVRPLELYMLDHFRMPSSYTPSQKAAIAQFAGFTSTKDSAAAKV